MQEPPISRPFIEYDRFQSQKTLTRIAISFQHPSNFRKTSIQLEFQIAINHSFLIPRQLLWMLACCEQLLIKIKGYLRVEYEPFNPPILLKYGIMREFAAIIARESDGVTKNFFPNIIFLSASPSQAAPKSGMLPISYYFSSYLL